MKKCGVFCPQPAQRSSKFGELRFVTMIAPSVVRGRHSHCVLCMVVFNLCSDLERRSFDNPVLQIGKRAQSG